MPNEETPDYNLTDEGLEIDGNLYPYSKISRVRLLYSGFMKTLGAIFLIPGGVSVIFSIMFLYFIIKEYRFSSFIIFLDRITELWQQNPATIEKFSFQVLVMLLAVGIVLCITGFLLIFLIRSTREVIIIYNNRRILIYRTKKKRYAVEMYYEIRNKLWKINNEKLMIKNEQKKRVENNELDWEDVIDEKKLKFLENGLLYRNEKTISYNDIGEVVIQKMGLRKLIGLPFFIAGMFLLFYLILIVPVCNEANTNAGAKLESGGVVIIYIITLLNIALPFIISGLLVMIFRNPTHRVILVMKDDRWLTVYSTYHKKEAFFTKESIEKRMRINLNA